jgi:hypothetical protein
MARGTLGEPVLRAVNQELRARGLRLTARDERRYDRRRPHGADIYYLIDNRYPDHVEIAPDVAVRHDVVERIAHRFSGTSPPNQGTTPTIGGRLAEITGEARFKVSIDPDDGPEELRAAEANLRASVDEAERYWARYADFGEVDHALNDRPDQDTPQRLLPSLRCPTGLIVARLVERPGYDELARVYQEQMRVWSDGFYLPRFEALMRYLAERSPEQLLAENQGPDPGRTR